MPSTLPNTVVILGTGGTIAGTSAEAGDNVGYSAAQRSAKHGVLALLREAFRTAVDVDRMTHVDAPLDSAPPLHPLTGAMRDRNVGWAGRRSGRQI